MLEDELSPEQVAARDEVHDLLQRHAGLLGPWEENDDIGPVDDTRFLTSWVLMASWTDAEGRSFLVRIPSRNLATHEIKGLCHEGLWGFDD